jgi:hypothetical protein
MKKILVCLLTIVSVTNLQAQDFGLSFSYFIPKNGDISMPVSPFSIRGVGLDLNKYVAIETGASLYRMSGLNLKDLPFESKRSLLGPNFTLLVPAELVIQLKGSRVEFDIKGGGFFFYGFAQKLNYGNFDRAIRAYNNWEVANADLSFKNNPGFGYHGGVELTVFVTSQVGISLECNYLKGQAKFPVTGAATGVRSAAGSTAEHIAIDYSDAKVDFRGLEFSVGVIFSSGSGGGSPKYKPKKRRR